MLQRARDAAELRQRRAGSRHLGLPALRLSGRPGPGQPPGPAAHRAVQDPPRLCAGAAQRRGRRGDPRRGARQTARRDLGVDDRPGPSGAWPEPYPPARVRLVVSGTPYGSREGDDHEGELWRRRRVRRACPHGAGASGGRGAPPCRPAPAARHAGPRRGLPPPVAVTACGRPSLASTALPPPGPRRHRPRPRVPRHRLCAPPGRPGGRPRRPPAQGRPPERPPHHPDAATHPRRPVRPGRCRLPPTVRRLAEADPHAGRALVPPEDGATAAHTRR
ncbi:hypothetical protein SGPA1_31441 [Streptomyces misionensis JCM 4497]